MSQFDGTYVDAVRKALQSEDLLKYEYYVPEFAVILIRALAILVNREEYEILEIAKILDEVNAKFDPMEWINEMQVEFKKVLESENIESIMNLPLTSAKSLAYWIENDYFNISEQTYEIEIAELFAVLSITQVGYGLHNHDRIKDVPDNIKYEKIDLMRIGQYVMEATEAIAYAEALIMSKRVEKAAEERDQRRRSDNARKAGKASQEKTNKLSRELYKFFLDKGYDNYTQATEDFLKTIPEERYRHLMPTNRKRTLRERLSRLVRGIDTL